MMLTVRLNKATIDNGDADKILREIREYITNRPNHEYRAILRDYLIKNSLRQTIERYTVLDMIAKHQGAFTVYSMYTIVDRVLCVSENTVRNTIYLLEDANIIKRINQETELFNTTYFELT